MALPPGVTAKTVTLGIGTFFDGTVVSGRVTITAPENVVHTATNRPLYSSEMTKPLVDGVVTFDLCPTDAEGLNNKSWTYKMKAEIQGAIKQPDVIWFTLPTAGPDTVDLDGLVTVPSSAGIPISVDVLTAGDLDPLTAGFVADTDSQTALALRAAFGLGATATDTAVVSFVSTPGTQTRNKLLGEFGRAAPVLSNFSYDAPTGNLLSYQEDGITITLTYNADGTVATSKRGTDPVQTFSYSGGNLVGVA